MATPHTQAPGAGNGGIVPPKDTRFGGPRANPQNPGGFPKGFVPLSRAYAIVAAMELSEVKQIAAGKKPKRWGKAPLRMTFVIAAQMCLAGTPPAAGEIADRTEGKVKNTTDLNVSAPDLAAAWPSA